jgi:hypothetical protein
MGVVVNELRASTSPRSRRQVSSIQEAREEGGSEEEQAVRELLSGAQPPVAPPPAVTPQAQAHSAEAASGQRVQHPNGKDR